MIPSPTPEVAAERPAAMRFIMLAVLIDMLAVGLIIPVLPSLVATFTGSQQDQIFWYGVVTFSFGIANFFGSPILGAMSDSVGRRPVLLLGFCGLAISFFGNAVAPSMTILVLIRFVAGAMQSNAAVANAYVADITPAADRAKRFGKLGAMVGLGFIFGPVMGGLLGAVNVHLPFVVAGCLALINLAYGVYVLPESLPPSARRPFEWRKANPVSALTGLTQVRGIGLLVAVVACSGLAQFLLYTSWVLYTQVKFGWGPLQNGWSLAGVGVMSVIVQGVLLGRLLKRFGARRLALYGLLSSALSYAAWGAATEGWMMFVVIFANVFGYTVTAAIQGMISGAVSGTEQGKTMGAVSALNSLMAVLAPVIGPPLLALVAHHPQGDWRIGAPFYGCAALQLVSLGLAWLHMRRTAA